MLNKQNVEIMSKTIDQIIRKTSNEPLKVVLKLMKPQIEKRVQDIANYELKETGRPMTAFGREITTMNLVHDLCKSILNYIDDADKVIEFDASTGNKGNFEINAQISRNGKQFLFSTEAILAGGYNVQCLHVRYIVRTDLPRTNNQSFAKEIKKTIAFKNKVQNKNEEISRFETRLKEYNQELKEMKTLTRESVIAKLKEEKNGESKWFEKKPLEDHMTWFDNQESFDLWIDETNEKNIQNILVRDVNRKKGDILRVKGYVKTAKKQLEKIKNK